MHVEFIEFGWARGSHEFWSFGMGEATIRVYKETTRRTDFGR